VWEFKTSTREWFWIGGEGYTQSPFAGSLQTKDNATQSPAARYEMGYASAGAEERAQGIWIYGGVGTVETLTQSQVLGSVFPLGTLSDLWFIQIRMFFFFFSFFFLM
jgi:hypothetical protein